MKKLGLVLAAVMALAACAMAQTTIFSDNMESFPTGWTLSPTAGWTKSSTQKYSGTYSARCDDVSPYANSQANYMTRSVSLTGYTSATLKFYIYQYTESGYDYVYCQYYSGSTWTTAWSRAGSYQSWAQQSVTIPTTATQVRFYFKSDASVTYAGAYIDDVVLTATGASTPTLAISSTTWAPAAAGATSSAVSVTNSGTTSVIAYTVSSDQTWLTVSAASGSTPGSFTMTAAANTGAARTATVTVTATTTGVSGSPKTIAVSQAAGTSGQNDAGSGGDAGNDFATATLVSPGSWTGCYLDATDRNDYYKFNVTSGQVIKVRIAPPSSADFDLYLYNPSQSQVASSTAGTGIVDSVIYTATVSGTFYARAYEYSGTGNYSLLISVSGGSSTPVLAVSMSSWAPTSAAQTSGTVNVTNSGSSSVIAYTVTSSQTWLTVSSASGNTPGTFTMTTTANTGTSARTATVTVAATGQTSKTIAVTQAAPGATDLGEPNETAATAYGPLTSGTTYNAYIWTATDVDYYKLNVTMAGAITVTLQNLPGDYDLYLYSTDGTTQLGSSTNGSTTNESISYTATAAGTYYVKVIGYNGVYSTTVAYALNATYPTGTPTPTLAISTTSWAPAATGATSSAVSVTNSATTSVIAYTVSSNQTWLTVSSASGSTPGSFTMTAAQNTGTSARTATVTVTATTGGVANSPQTITVNQPAPGTSAYEWTIMVYLNGDNNLEQYGFTNFNQIAAASQSSGKYRVVVQFDRAVGYDATNGDWTTTKRFLVTPGMTATAANQISDIGEADMGSPTTLSTFANWAIDNYPANHYFLVFWDHGSGWSRKNAKADCDVLKDFSNDDSSGNSISIASGEFATAMNTIKTHLGRKIDVIGWDCCLMGMPEVIDVSKDYADVAFVSEETEAGTGWNYTPLCNAVNSNPTISGLEMLKALINGTGSSGLDTQADIDLSKVSALNTAISTFADQLMAAKAAGYTSVIHTQEAAAKGMYTSEHRDLWDFANRISTASVPAALVTAASGVKTAINNAVYYYLMSSSFSTCHGLAIYLPLATGTSYSTSYNNLPFAANTHWDEYVKGQTAPTVTNPDPGATNTRFANRSKPLAFELCQSVPNPIVDKAMLSFQLDKAGYTSLKIYNLNGQLVKTLVSGQCGAGWHDLTWDLKDNAGQTVSAGVYMYTLQNGASRDSRRMIVVK